jgi:hypothetical protein
MSAVWEAYEIVRTSVLAQIDMERPTDDVEREITEHFELALRRAIPGHGPFDVRHAVCERESRADPPAQPPLYDIAFQLRENPRVMWPIEAKVLRTPGRVADYVTTVRTRFLTCVYAPFSAEGTMVAYLLSGRPNDVFKQIEARIPCALLSFAPLFHRPHRYSQHVRSVPSGKPYSRNLKLHHLILDFTSKGPEASHVTEAAMSG